MNVKDLADVANYWVDRGLGELPVVFLDGRGGVDLINAYEGQIPTTLAFMGMEYGSASDLDEETRCMRIFID